MAARYSGVSFFGYEYFDSHILVPLLMVIWRQFLDTVIRYLFLVIMISSRVNFHAYISIECFHNYF